MSGKSPRKTNTKKQGKTLKEKQTAKKLEKAKARVVAHPADWPLSRSSGRTPTTAHR